MPVQGSKRTFAETLPPVPSASLPVTGSAAPPLGPESMPQELSVASTMLPLVLFVPQAELLRILHK